MKSWRKFHFSRRFPGLLYDEIWVELTWKFCCHKSSSKTEFTFIFEHGKVWKCLRVVLSQEKFWKFYSKAFSGEKFFSSLVYLCLEEGKLWGLSYFQSYRTTHSEEVLEVFMNAPNAMPNAFNQTIPRRVFISKIFFHPNTLVTSPFKKSKIIISRRRTHETKYL